VPGIWVPHDDHEPKETRLTLPDPGFDATRFVAWLKKRGRVRALEDCERKCGQLGLDLDHLLRMLEPDYLCRFRTSRGGKVVMIMDLPWADKCMEHYGIEVPHHGHPLLRGLKAE
jgi:hypothetical protein